MNAEKKKKIKSAFKCDDAMNQVKVRAKQVSPDKSAVCLIAVVTGKKGKEKVFAQELDVSTGGLQV